MATQFLIRITQPDFDTILNDQLTQKFEVIIKTPLWILAVRLSANYDTYPISILHNKTMSSENKSIGCNPLPYKSKQLKANPDHIIQQKPVKNRNPNNQITQ